MSKLLAKFTEFMGWHTPGRDPRNIVMFDGASLHATCKNCGKDIMQDSQGNWF